MEEERGARARKVNIMWQKSRVLGLWRKRNKQEPEKVNVMWQKLCALGLWRKRSKQEPIKGDIIELLTIVVGLNQLIKIIGAKTK